MNGAASGEPEVDRRHVAGRVGRSVSRFDEALSRGMATGAGKAGRRLGDMARSKIQSGMWQDYAFLVLAAVVLLALVVVVARGCAGAVGP